MRGLVDEMDHQVSVIAAADPHALDSVDPAKIMRRGEAMRPLLDWRGEKENAGRFTWTLGLYGTPGDGRRGRHGEEEYWEQIMHACFLDERRPDRALARGRQRVEQTRERLDALEIERLHVEGEDVDLWVSVGEQRRWLGGRGSQHPELRDLHEPRLARHRGLDLLQPAALPLRQPRQGHPPDVRRRARDARRAPRRTSACSPR